MKNKKLRKLWGIPLFILIFAALVWATMLLWNALLPAIFGVTIINYWQALGLLVLGRLLFGGFGKGGGWHHFRRHHHGRHGCCRRGGDDRRFEGRGHDHHFDKDDMREFMREGGEHFGDRGGERFRKMMEKMKSMSKDERREFFRNRMHNRHMMWEEMFDDLDNPDKKSASDEQQ